jgi:hypothetical protein
MHKSKALQYFENHFDLFRNLFNFTYKIKFTFWFYENKKKKYIYIENVI